MKLFDRAKVAGYIPDVVLVDGSGVLHPRHCGSASHLGVVANIPTIGITKSLIQWESKELSTSLRPCINKRVKEELGKELKQHSVVMALPMNRHDSPPLGVVVCPFGTRKPIFVSPGHRISLHSAAQVALRCCKHRIPEPIRLADIESRRSAREMKLS